jgi:hypothetical protein
LVLALSAQLSACGSDSNTLFSSSGGSKAQAGSGSGVAGEPSNTGGKSSNNGGGTSGSSSTPEGEHPTGWLYTDGNKIKLSDGKGGGSVWVGRGVNTDDLFFCGYNGTLWMPAPAAELKNVLEGIIKDWKPSFIRLSLAMATNPTTVDWFKDVDNYQKPMTDIVKGVGKHEGVYLLLALRSDASMIGEDEQHGDPEATGIPSDSKTTPDKAKFPQGTDPLYVALVDAFKDDKFVMFGLTNEPGGILLPDAQIAAAMDHAAATIRAEEDRLKVPHHIISVQGQAWTSVLSYYAENPLPYDNVVYELHGYPPKPEQYTFDSLPIIIGEYGGLDTASAPAVLDDLEAKKIPSLAWDFDSFSNCAPDLVEANQSSTDLKPTEWGKLVQGYLLAHAGK